MCRGNPLIVFRPRGAATVLRRPVQQDTGNKTVTSGAEPFTVDNDDYPLDLLTLSLVRRIYAAATHTDYAELNRLLRNYCSEPASAEDAQIKLWHNPEVLREMAAILLTHGATTVGYTYPGFAIAGFTDVIRR